VALLPLLWSGWPCRSCMQAVCRHRRGEAKLLFLHMKLFALSVCFKKPTKTALAAMLLAFEMQRYIVLGIIRIHLISSAS